MRIRLSDPGQVADLLHFLRVRDCITYAVDDLQTVEVIRPHAFGEREQQEIRELLDAWLADNPDADVKLE